MSTKNAVQLPSSFTPDGRRLFFFEPPPDGGGFDIWTLPLMNDGAAVRPGPAEPFLEGGQIGLGRALAVSPDGRWLAYDQRGPPEPEVYVQLFATSSSTPGSRLQISNNGGDWPVWSRTAHELFYSSAGNIMAVPYTVKGDTLRGGPAADLGTAAGRYRSRRIRPGARWQARRGGGAG